MTYHTFYTLVLSTVCLLGLSACDSVKESARYYSSHPDMKKGFQKLDHKGAVVEEYHVPPPTADKPAPAMCEFARYKGQPVDAVVAELKQLDVPFRVLPPGSMRTMDHVPDRINLETDGNGIITRIFCG
jgi:hypothetical protein